MSDEYVPPQIVTRDQALLETRRANQDAFLVAFAKHGTVRLAAMEAKVPYGSHADWLEIDPEYAARWEEAKNIVADLAEEEAIRRGINGWEEPVIRQVTRVEGEQTVSTWEQVATIRKYSDRMLELILKALRPEKYRERVEHSGRVGLSLEEVMVRGHEKARRAVTEGGNGRHADDDHSGSPAG